MGAEGKLKCCNEYVTNFNDDWPKRPPNAKENQRGSRIITTKEVQHTLSMQKEGKALLAACTHPKTPNTRRQFGVKPFDSPVENHL